MYGLVLQGARSTFRDKGSPAQRFSPLHPIGWFPVELLSHCARHTSYLLNGIRTHKM